MSAGRLPALSTLLETPPGYASRQVARFMWQLDEQSRRLGTDLVGIGADELEWQAAPGMNTIGMLLAHIAFSETHLAQVGLLGEPVGHAHDVIGIREEDEGLPLPPDGRPPAALANAPFDYFRELLERARVHTRQVAYPLTDQDLERIVTRPRPDGSLRVFNVGWVLYHMLEHEAGHHAQINMLRHLYRDRATTPSA
jgi:hypothetical protein